METKKAPASRGIVIGLALGAVMGALSGFSELGFVLAPAFLGFVLRQANKICRICKLNAVRLRRKPLYDMICIRFCIRRTNGG